MFSRWITKGIVFSLVFAGGYISNMSPARASVNIQVVKMAPNWDMKNWTTGKPMSFFQALGFKKNLLNPPQLQPQLAISAAKHASSTPRKKPAPKGRPVKSSGNPSGGTPQQNQRLGQVMAARYGWTGQQWTALNNIVMAESGWNTSATNPSSGAYGIPQALPGSKMGSIAGNWRTSAHTQIAWLLLYIRQRYGNPVNAWAFHLANGWY